MGKMIVAVGSLNPVKIRSVSRVLSRFYDVEVRPVSVEVSIPRQPIGILDVLLGSLERAYKSLELVESASWGIGIEAGPIEFYSSSGFLEAQVAVIIDRLCRVSVGLSPSFELRPEIVKLMVSGVELSQVEVIPRGLGDIGEHIGYIGYVTRGYITRQVLTEMAIAMALTPRLQNAEWLMDINTLLSNMNIIKRYECFNHI